MSDTVFELNPELNAAALRAAFAEAQRLQIRDFLTPRAADALQSALSGVDWHLVMNDRDRHIDLPVSWLPNLGLDRIRKAIAQARQRAATEFQYVYENYPVADAFESGNLKNETLAGFFRFMNSEPVRACLAAVTGHTTDFCDMQITKYGPGHILTGHDDAIEGKNRKFAYVLGLTPHWAPIWGGQLQFLSEEDQVTQSIVPAFNALSVFSVPVRHHVTEVASFAPHARVSATGWFRTYD